MTKKNIFIAVLLYLFLCLEENLAEQIVIKSSVEMPKESKFPCAIFSQTQRGACLVALIMAAEQLKTNNFYIDDFKIDNSASETEPDSIKVLLKASDQEFPDSRLVSLTILNYDCKVAATKKKKSHYETSEETYEKLAEAFTEAFDAEKTTIILEFKKNTSIFSLENLMNEKMTDTITVEEFLNKVLKDSNANNALAKIIICGSNKNLTQNKIHIFSVITSR